MEGKLESLLVTVRNQAIGHETSSRVAPAPTHLPLPSPNAPGPAPRQPPPHRGPCSHWHRLKSKQPSRPPLLRPPRPTAPPGSGVLFPPRVSRTHTVPGATPARPGVPVGPAGGGGKSGASGPFPSRTTCWGRPKSLPGREWEGPLRGSGRPLSPTVSAQPRGSCTRGRREGHGSHGLPSRHRGEGPGCPWEARTPGEPPHPHPRQMQLQWALCQASQRPPSPLASQRRREACAAGEPEGPA